MHPSSTQQGDILVVDDVADNLRLLSDTLSSYGYTVRPVRNGAMALIGAKAIPPDVILLDIRMPEMDGYEVCRQLKADPQLCNIPIIFLSAIDETEDKAKAFDVGGADYITKPFQVEEVLARVKNQLNIQQLKKQVAEQKKLLEQLAANWSNLSKLQSEIATILDYSARLCQDPTVSQEQLTMLEAIHQNSQTSLNLLNELLGESNSLTGSN